MSPLSFFEGILGHSYLECVRLAYRNGVTTAITAPTGNGFLHGVSTAFSAGSPNALATGAVLQEETALHVSISLSLGPSVSTQIAALRTQLFESSLTPWVRVRKVCYSFLMDSLPLFRSFIAYRETCRLS